MGPEGSRNMESISEEFEKKLRERLLNTRGWDQRGAIKKREGGGQMSASKKRKGPEYGTSRILISGGKDKGKLL